MVDYAAGQRVATRPRARARESTYLRNLDWALLLAVGGIIAYGLWVISGITQDDVQGDPNYYVVRQAGFALAGVRRDVRDDARRPGLLAQACAGRLRRPDRDARPDSDPRLERPQHAPLDRHRAVPLPAVRVREAPARPLPGRVPRRAREADLRPARRRWPRSGFAAVPIVLVFLQPDFGTAIVYAGILGATLFIAGTRWSHVAVLLALGAFLATFVLWARARRSASTC